MIYPVAAAKITINGTDYVAETANEAGINVDMAGKPGRYTVSIAAEDMAGNRLESNFSFEVITSLDSMRALIDRYVKLGQLKTPAAAQLTNSLKIAQLQLDNGRPDQAAKHMADFIKHLENNNVNENVKISLKADASQLMKT